MNKGKNALAYICLYICKGPFIYNVRIFGVGRGLTYYNFSKDYKRTKWGEGQNIPHLRRRYLWTAPNLLVLNERFDKDPH